MTTTNQPATADATRAQVAVWLVQMIAKAMWGSVGGALLGAIIGGMVSSAGVFIGAIIGSFVAVAVILSVPGDPRKA